MKKTHTFSIKISDEEAKIFKAQAAALALTNGDYFRLLISTKEPKNAAPEAPKSGENLDRIEAKISTLAAQFGAFISAQREQKRVPSFYEFRARKIVETRPAAPKTPTEKFSFFLEMAREFHSKYGLWPDPADHVNFGPGLTPEQVAMWPDTPR